MRNWNDSSGTRKESLLFVYSLPMRNWNFSSPTTMWSNTLVYSLPMRNWNWSFSFIFPVLLVFIAYLWGIETRTSAGQFSGNSQFIAYLWGIETNIFKQYQLEGLKFIAYLWGIETSINTKCKILCVVVYSLPMRNWNWFTVSQASRNGHKFIAYLWGIETSKRPGNKLWFIYSL